MAHVCNWRPPACCKLLRLLQQHFLLFCKQASQSLQYFKGKPTDAISGVPVTWFSRTLPFWMDGRNQVAN